MRSIHSRCEPQRSHGIAPAGAPIAAPWRRAEIQKSAGNHRMMLQTDVLSEPGKRVGQQCANEELIPSRDVIGNHVDQRVQRS